MTQQQEKALEPIRMTYSEVMTVGKTLALSHFFRDVKDQAQAVAKILAGQELGFGPIYSMTKIYVIEGRIALSAEAMAVLVKRSREYDYQVKTLTDQECVLVFLKAGKEEYTSRFTMEDAKKARLVKDGSAWTTFTRAMLFARAISQGARIVCPHLIGGCYTPEDLGVIEGEIVESPPQGAIASPPATPGGQVTGTAASLVPPAQATSVETASTKPPAQGATPPGATTPPPGGIPPGQPPKVPPKVDVAALGFTNIAEQKAMRRSLLDILKEGVKFTDEAIKGWLDKKNIASTKELTRDRLLELIKEATELKSLAEAGPDDMP